MNAPLLSATERKKNQRHYLRLCRESAQKGYILDAEKFLDWADRNWDVEPEEMELHHKLIDEARQRNRVDFLNREAK